MTTFRQAFALSKDEVEAAVPPGTIDLLEYRLERTTSGRNVDQPSLHLIPTPSADPADPLNWSSSRKLGCTFAVCCYSFVSNFTSSSIASALPYLAAPILFHPPVSIANLTHLIATNVLMLGASNLFWVPLANTFGRRPIVLVALLILTLTSAWAGLAKSFGSLLAARTLMGVGAGAADALCPDVVGEMFFVHQRGRALAVYTFFLSTGSLMGGLCGGYILGNLGYTWIHWTNVLLSAICFTLCLFFQPETLFNRREAMRSPSLTSQDNVSVVDNEINKSGSSRVEQIHRFEPEERSFPAYTYTRSLVMGTYRPGFVHRLSVLMGVLRLPGVWLVCLWYSGLIGGIVTISTIGPTLLSMPPYLWGHNVGLINIGGLIGTLLGAIYTGLVADWSLKRSARKTHGMAEPESRLPLVIPSLVLATVGMWVFGFSAAHPSPNGWVGLEVGLGMVCFGLMMVPSIGFNYLLDSYNAVSGDCFVMVTCLRAIVSFSWTFFVGTWVERDGAALPFGIFGMLMGVFALLVIPFLLYGKRMRIATAKFLPVESEH